MIAVQSVNWNAFARVVLIFKNRLKEVNKPKLNLFHRAGYDDKIQIILSAAAKEGEKKHILQKKEAQRYSSRPSTVGEELK